MRYVANYIFLLIVLVGALATYLIYKEISALILQKQNSSIALLEEKAVNQVIKKVEFKKSFLNSIERFFLSSSNIDEKEYATFGKYGIEESNLEAVCWHSNDGRQSYAFGNKSEYCRSFDVLEPNQVFLEDYRMMISSFTQSATQKGFASIVFAIPNLFENSNNQFEYQLLFHDLFKDNIQLLRYQGNQFVEESLESSEARITKFQTLLENPSLRVKFNVKSKPIPLELSPTDRALLASIFLSFIIIGFFFREQITKRRKIALEVEEKTKFLKESNEDLRVAKEAADKANLAKFQGNRL